jgi:hypothetical protein
MPRGDGTGPMGMRPITGRGAGCIGFNKPGFMNTIFGHRWRFRKMFRFLGLMAGCGYIACCWLNHRTQN